MTYPHPEWPELLRVLWPVFVLIGGLAVAGVLLALKSIFVTRDAHKDHDTRITVIEVFKTQQETALGLIPSRQDLGRQITAQGEKITETKEELSDTLAEQGERIAGVEAGLAGVSRQLETTNTYLHTLLERGLRP